MYKSFTATSVWSKGSFDWSDPQEYEVLPNRASAPVTRTAICIDGRLNFLSLYE